MKKLIPAFRQLPLLLAVLSLLNNFSSFSQCNNSGFENCDFTGWTGTNCKSDSSTVAATCQLGSGCGYAPSDPLSGLPTCFYPCIVIPGTTSFSAPDPFKFPNMSIGAVNQKADSLPENSHFIMKSGFDPIAGGTNIPVVCPGGGSCSARLGNGQGGGGGESMMYKFVVDASNTSFTYNYAVVLTDGGHTDCQQAYFKIRMWVYNCVNPGDSCCVNGNASVDCATYDVDASSAPNIPGFQNDPIDPSIWWKSWTPVTVPLQSYIGKTVSFQFITRDCCPGCAVGSGTCSVLGMCNNTNGIGGGHYAYAYIDASCAPLQIIPSAPSVCPGQSVTLTAPIGAASYSWTGPKIVSGAATQTVTVNGSGTYTVNMTTFGTVSCPYSLTVVMPGNLPGQVVTVNSPTICSGESAVLTASGGGPYLWATSGETTVSITVSPTIKTTYSVTGGACPSTATATVTVNPLPTVTVVPSTICSGANSTLTANGASTYLWSNSAIGNILTSANLTSNTSFTVTGTSTFGCTSTAAGTIGVNPLPTITVTPTTVCAGTTGTITANGANTYVWSGVSGASFTASPATNTSYSVIGTDINGCTGTAAGTITVNSLQSAAFSYTLATVCKLGGTDPIPVITGTPGGTFTCSTNTVTINASSGVITLSLTAVGTYTVSYTTPGPCPNTQSFVLNIVNIPKADFTLGVYCQNDVNPTPLYINGGTAGTFSESTGSIKFASPASFPGEIDLSTSSIGTFTVTNTINSPGCPLTFTVSTIIINPIPTITINNSTVCAGTTATLTANGANTYSWSSPLGSAAGSLTDTPITTTSYTVTGGSAGCSSSNVGTITVTPMPTVTVNNSSACAGIPQTITASGALSYSWSGGGTPSGQNLTDSPSSPTTTYTVTGTILGCSSTNMGTITVNPSPTVTAADAAVCSGAPATLTAYSTVPGTTFAWLTPLAQTTFSITVNPPSTTTFTVIGTALGCLGSAMPVVFVSPTPTVTVNSTSVCAGLSGTLTATGADTYVWSPGGFVGNPLVALPSTTTLYTVIGATSGCTASAIGTISVNPIPTITINSKTICAGQSTILAASGAISYVWPDNSATTTFPVSSSSSLATTTVTSYTIVGTSAGCSSIGTGTVTVNPLPVITVTNDTICPGETATIIASDTTGVNTTYHWSNGNAGALLSISPLPGNHLFTVTGTNLYNCAQIADGTILVYQIPTVDFSISPDIIIVSAPTANFNNQSSSDVNYWNWNFGDGDTLSPNTSSPAHTYVSVDSTYIVTLNVHNAGGCPNTISHPVRIWPEYSFFMPNAFTPNGDGINDTFFGKGKGIIKYDLMIFDRWGNFIFHADDINKGWDGKATGGSDMAQQDVYVWKVALTDIFKKQHNFIGTVIVMRGK